jgi:hypothetical protein
MKPMNFFLCQLSQGWLGEEVEKTRGGQAHESFGTFFLISQL